MAQVSEFEVVVGGYYYTRYKEGYTVSKVLAINPGIVHLRSYRNLFTSVPTPDDIPSLTLNMTMEDLMAIAKDPQNAGPIGIGHSPISRQGFLNDSPVLFAIGNVEDDELEGYRDWERAFGRDGFSEGAVPSESWFRRLFRKGGSSVH